MFICYVTVVALYCQAGEMLQYVPVVSWGLARAVLCGDQISAHMISLSVDHHSLYYKGTMAKCWLDESGLHDEIYVWWPDGHGDEVFTDEEWLETNTTKNKNMKKKKSGVALM